MNTRAIASAVLPRRVLAGVKGLRAWYNDHRFTTERFVSVRLGRFDLDVPGHHALLRHLKSQPLRDRSVAVAARLVSGKYPDASFVDIGANIGDTAALMASEAANHLILIEASAFYFPILARNARRFPNPITLVNALIADGEQLSGHLRHVSGTAAFVEDDGPRTPTRRLCDVADLRTKLVKTDTDGFDFKILRQSLGWLAETRPAVLFEDLIRTHDDLAAANELLEGLRSIGYDHFVVWDDAGCHIVSTSDPRTVADLHRYLYSTWQQAEPKGIFNYDVLCIHAEDTDIYEGVRKSV